MTDSIDQFSVCYLRGDYTKGSLPGENDIADTFRTRPEAEREMKLIAAENGIPSEHYGVIRRHVTEWVMDQ